AQARADDRSHRREGAGRPAPAAVRRACSGDSALPGSAVWRVHERALRGLSRSGAPVRAALAQLGAGEPAGPDGARAPMRYVLRRLGFYLVAAWASATLAFLIPRLMPGDPASALAARFQGKLRPESLDALRRTFGFTGASLPRQYATYLQH